MDRPILRLHLQSQRTLQVYCTWSLTKPRPKHWYTTPSLYYSLQKSLHGEVLKYSTIIQWTSSIWPECRTQHTIRTCMSKSCRFMVTIVVQTGSASEARAVYDAAAQRKKRSGKRARAVWSIQDCARPRQRRCRFTERTEAPRCYTYCRPMCVTTECVALPARMPVSQGESPVDQSTRVITDTYFDHR